MIRCFSKILLIRPPITRSLRPTFSVLPRDIHSISCLIEKIYQFRAHSAEATSAPFIGRSFIVRLRYQKSKICWSQFFSILRILLIISINKELRNRQSCCLSIFKLISSQQRTSINQQQLVFLILSNPALIWSCTGNPEHSYQTVSHPSNTLMRPDRKTHYLMPVPYPQGFAMPLFPG